MIDFLLTHSLSLSAGVFYQDAWKENEKKCGETFVSARRSLREQESDEWKLKLEAELIVEEGAWCGHRGRHEGAVHGQAAR